MGSNRERRSPRQRRARRVVLGIGRLCQKIQHQARLALLKGAAA